MKRFLVFAMLVMGLNAFGGENVINVNINSSDFIRERTTVGIGFGLTTPIIGTYKEISIAGKKYTKSVTGINSMIGFTSRNYLGDGLTANGGTGYFEIGTLFMFVPFVGVGYDYKIGENIIIGAGFPDMLHMSMAF